MNNSISLKQHVKNLKNGIYQLNDDCAGQYYPDLPNKLNAVVNIKYFNPSAENRDGSIGKWFYGYRIIENYFE